jgi:cell division protein FtsZ
MGCGSGSGENRIEDAVKNALESPLLNDFDLKTAKNVLINITVGENEQGLTMAQYGKITEMIQSYTGNANNFKSGIVFDENPDFGDKVNITVIVTGINTVIMEPQINMGNIIIIDEDFEYTKELGGGESIDLPEVRTQKIGYNSTAIRKKNLFEDGTKPVLILEEGMSKSELESTAAIRRKANCSSKREE